MKLLSFLALASAGLSAAAAVNTPELYALPSGETDTLAASATFGAMRVAGDLVVQGAAVTCADIATTGGAVRVTGSGASLGNAASTVWNVSSNALGGVATRLSAEASGKIGITRLDLNLDDAELAAAPGFAGVFDFLSLSNATVTLKRCWNHSSATGRIVVAGTSSLKRPGGYDGAGTFQKGAYLVELRDGATLNFDTENQKGTLAVETGTSVRFVGDGDVRFVSGTELTGGYTFPLFANTVLDNAGAVIFEPVHTGTRIHFRHGALFGPNVTRLETRKVSYEPTPGQYRLEIHVPNGVEVALPPETEVHESARLCGTGGLLLDAARRPVSFAGSMDASAGCSLTLRKTGAHEARVVSTNLVNVVVEEGTLRIVRDCAVRTVRVQPGAHLVVDGCRLVLQDGSYLLDAAVECVNGGTVLKAGEGSAELYRGSRVDGPVHVAGGSLMYTDYGLPHRHWRFVIRKNSTPATADKWFNLDRLWLFGADGSHVGTDLSYQAQDEAGAETELPEGKVRFVAPEKLVHSTTDSWNGLDRLAWLFTRPNENVNMNNFPWLKGLSRDIDPADPATWVAIEWKLPAATAQPVVGYNLAYCDPGKYPVSWNLEYYDEAAGAWVVADARDDEAVVPPPNSWDGYYYYDGVSIPSLVGRSPAERFHLAGYRRDGLAAVDAPLVARVDAGAAFDLRAITDGVQEIGSLTLDAAGAGTIHGGRLAAAGTLAIVGSAENLGAASVPLDLDGTLATERLADWSVSLFGADMPGLSLSYDAENRCVALPSVRVVQVTESGEVDILAGLAPGQGVCVDVADGVTCTNAAALAGAHPVFKRGAGTLVLDRTAADGYDASVVVFAGTLAGAADDAFGSGTVSILGSTTETCRVLLGSAAADTAYANDFVLLGDSSASHVALQFVTSGLKKTQVNGAVVAHGYLAVTDSGSGSAQGRELVFFNGPVDAAGFTVNYPADNSVQWKGALRAGTLRAAATYPRMGRHDLWSADNAIGLIDLAYISCVARGENVFGGARLNFAGDNNEAGRGFFNLYGKSQVAAYVTQDHATLKVKEFRNGSLAATLTLTGGVATAVCRDVIAAGTGEGRRVSLVVDAGNDDFVQEFRDSASTTAGDFEIRNGTLRFAGTARAANVPSVAVAGGAFEVWTSAEGAFGAVTNLSVGAGARVSVSADAVSPFGTATGATASATELALAADAVLELPAGAVVDVDRLVVDGRMKAAGAYTGAGGAGGRVLQQISGAGVLRVRRGNGGTVLLFR